MTLTVLGLARHYVLYFLVSFGNVAGRSQLAPAQKEADVRNGPTLIVGEIRDITCSRVVVVPEMGNVALRVLKRR